MKRTFEVLVKKITAALLLLAGDFLAIACGFIIAYFIRAWFLVDVMPIMKPMMHGFGVYVELWIMLVLWPLIFFYDGLYPSIGMGFWEETKHLVKGNFIVFLIIILLTFVTKTSDMFSRPLIAIAFISTMLFLPVFRKVSRKLLRILKLWTEEVVLIGRSEALNHVYFFLKKHPDLGLKPIGSITYESEESNPELIKLGSIENLEKINVRANEVIIAIPGATNAELVEIIEKSSHIAAIVNVLPDLNGIASTGVGTHDLNGMLLLEMEDRLARLRNRFIKRVFDFIISAGALLALLPLFLIIILFIKTNSRGPAIFGHKRVGKGGKTFTCYKFRTMVANAQEVLQELLDKDPEARRQWDLDFKLKNDPRITRIGGFLRKTSLDELPQLINVLKGEMSLVGPRPIVEKEIERYGNKSKYFFKVTPGITGLWQVSGRNDIGYEERVMLDEYYAKNWSLWLDIEIIIRTFGAVLKKEGAY